MDAAAEGSTALSNKDFTAAVKHYTRAIGINSLAVDYYIKRSTAYIRQSSSNPLLALLDAETAVALAYKRGKRELIAQSQMRRGIALYTSERYGDAAQCFEWVEKFDPKEKSLTMWNAKIQSKLADLNDDDDKRGVNVKEMPEVDVDELTRKETRKGEALKAEQKKGDAQPVSASESKSQAVQTPASKIRHDWYQSTETVTISLMVKGVPEANTRVEFLPGSLNVSFPLSTGSDFNFSLDPLFADIDDHKSSYKVMSTKVEFTLKKAIPGQKWPSLEGNEPDTVSEDISATNAPDSTKPAVTRSQLQTTVPSYPTSSKSGPKNWDKLASDLTKKESKKESEDGSKRDDEAYGSDDDADPVNGFFKKLYKDADPDTRRAMMKSYQESNGTALSTNWKEVGKAPVETTPPEGMVAKKW